jgi:hypothetical protein
MMEMDTLSEREPFLELATGTATSIGELERSPMSVGPTFSVNASETDHA